MLQSVGAGVDVVHGKTSSSAVHVSMPSESQVHESSGTHNLEHVGP